MNNNKPYDNKELRRRITNRWSWWILLIIVVLTAAVRIRLLDVPLERDEGEYAYAGQLILQGIPPYAQVYNMKMPGIYAAYALILAVFGQTHTGIHLGLLVINAATILLLFLLAKKLFDPFTALVAAAAFAMMSLSQSVQGIFANAEHFVVLLVIAGLLILLHALDYKKSLFLLVAAVLLGLAFLMKQHGAAFIIFAGLYLFFCELRRRPFTWKTSVARSVLFLIGVLLPFATACLLLWWSGVFEKFWFWTFEYAREYVTSLPLSVGMNELKEKMTRIAGSAVLLWGLAGVGLTALCWNRKVRQQSPFVAGFLLFSFLAVCPGLYFRWHYFILFLPAVALLAGIGAGSIQDIFSRSQPKLMTRKIPLLLVLAALFHAGYQQRHFLFDMSPAVASRATYGKNPFPESLEIARFISHRSSKDDRIAVIGSEPQIYFYSNRRSATGYIYTYALMEPHPYATQMQQEMIREIETASPEFLVLVGVPTSWLVRPRSERMIFEWFQQYQQKYYRQVGVIDIISRNKTISLWGQDSLEYSPRSDYWLLIFQRNSQQQDDTSSLKSDDAGTRNLPP